MHACAVVQALCDLGYSASDIITIFFRVVRNFPGMNEYLKLEYIKVRSAGGSLQIERDQQLQDPFCTSLAHGLHASPIEKVPKLCCSKLASATCGWAMA
jgi:hypothetical protein